MLILKIPASRPAKSGAVDPKMRLRILEYLDGLNGKEPDDIIAAIAEDVLLNRFGYGIYEGRRIAVRALQLLEREGEVTCGFRETRVRVARKKKPEHAPAVIRVVNRSVPLQSAAVLKRKPRRTVTPEQRGERNELRFFSLMRRLAVNLRRNLPEVIRGAQASRSENHDPLSGIVSIRDLRGDDVSLRLRTVRGVRNVWLIYDVKSSRAATYEFNGSVRRIRGQRNASLKRAITVNPRRSDSDIVREVLDDLSRTGLLDAASYRTILEDF